MSIDSLPASPMAVDAEADTGAAPHGNKMECGEDWGNRSIQGIQFFVMDYCLFKDGLIPKLVANFFLTVEEEKIRTDGDKVTGRTFEMCFHQQGKDIYFSVRQEDFTGNKLLTKVREVAGHKAILYGSAKDLSVAAQEFSGGAIPETMLSTSVGFDDAGHYVADGIVITPQAILRQKDHKFDLSESRFARNLGFLVPDDLQVVREVGETIYRHFLRLKSPRIMHPLLGHICLAPFSSRIASITGRKKPALHLEGHSGCGKLFLGTLAMSFFGTFDDQVMSWEATKNAIEAEGYYFRDSLYLVDDFKLGCTDRKTFVEVVQRYSDGHGRSRLNANGTMNNLYFIRGLLLSTGEDFVSEMESVSARTILLKVEKSINQADGHICWRNRGMYRTFLPGIIQGVISNERWEEEFHRFVDSNTDLLLKEATHLSNGLRIASNWALNAWGFAQCLRFLQALGVIDSMEGTRMNEEYFAIAVDNLKDQATCLIQSHPATIFFETLGQSIAAGEALVYGLKGSLKTGKPVGKAKPNEGVVYIFPDEALETVISRFRAIGQRSPFSKNSLRDALVNDDLIKKVKDGRWTVQVRLPGGTRHQAWEIDIEKFEKRCCMSDNDR